MNMKEDQIVNHNLMICLLRSFKNFIKLYKLEINHQNIMGKVIYNGDVKKKEIFLKDNLSHRKIKFFIVVNK